MSSTIQIDDPIKKRPCQKVVICIVGTLAILTLVTLLAVCGLFAYTMINHGPITETSESNVDEITEAPPLYESDLSFCNNKEVYFKGHLVKDGKVIEFIERNRKSIPGVKIICVE